MNVVGSFKKVLGTHSLILTYWKPVVTLLIITPILTEILTNNIPATHLFEPELFFLMATLVYGPVLLLRELAVKWNLKITGYILLGIVYGIYNEGLLGRTFFNLQIANTAFDHYGIVWGFNLPWTALIITFHAFYAFLFPILIVYNIFPGAAFKPWVNEKWWIGISVVCLLYVSYKFLNNTFPVSPYHYVVLIAVITGRIVLSRLFIGGLIVNGKKPRLWLLVCCGLVFVGTTFTITDIIARSEINYLFFLVYAVINLLAATIFLGNKYSISTLLVFAFAAQLGFAACLILVSVWAKSQIGIITGSVFVAIFVPALLTMIVKERNKYVSHKVVSLE